jgi:hypothetical protein
MSHGVISSPSSDIEFENLPIRMWARGNVVGLKHYATNRKVAGSISDEVTGFFDRPNPSGRTLALGSTPPLTEMSVSNLLGGKGQPARKADNLIANCDRIV